MQCPKCGSEHIRKNGHRRGKQNHICVNCGRQFIDQYNYQGLSSEIKQLCLELIRKVNLKKPESLTMKCNLI